jgi:3-oxoacyl-[acyl-carrier protein] reductase
MDLGLKGKIALVAGGSRGLGKAVAWELAQEGCVVAIAARDPQNLQKTSDELSQLTSTSWHSSDLSQRGAGTILVNEVIARHG